MRDAPARSVVIVGGGVIGMACALELAAVVGTCTLVDPAPGRGATWAAAGMLSPAAEVAPGETIIQDLVAALSLWPGFAARLGAASGIDVGFEPSSSILVGATPSDDRDLARTVRLMAAVGVGADALAPERVREMEPTLSSGLRGGWLLSNDHRVDNRLLAEALLAALKAAGVSIVEDRCAGLLAEPSGIRLSLEHQGTLHAEKCVLATGAAPKVPGTEHLGLPRVRPVRGVTVRLGAVAGVSVPSRTIRGVVDGIHCYLVPRSDGSLVIGATSEEQGMALVARAGGVHQLLDVARAVLPAVDELAFDEAAVGLRPATDDHVPFVSRLRDPRIVAALGHYRNGILLSPLTARAVARLVT